MKQDFLKIITLLILTLSLGACAKKTSSETSIPETESKGERVFQMDRTKPIVAISVYGVAMGTPDAPEIENYIAEAETAGLISNVRQGLYGIEGGFTFCAEASSAEDLETLFADLQGIPTDSQQTNYRAVSLDACPF